jgi:hypothetical protein
VKNLRYLGDLETGYPALRGVPARDLEPADIARLAFVKGKSTSSVRAWLVASGLYRDEPSKAAAKEGSTT